MEVTHTNTIRRHGCSRIAPALVAVYPSIPTLVYDRYLVYNTVLIDVIGGAVIEYGAVVGDYDLTYEAFDCGSVCIREIGSRWHIVRVGCDGTNIASTHTIEYNNYHDYEPPHVLRKYPIEFGWNSALQYTRHGRAFCSTCVDDHMSAITHDGVALPLTCKYSPDGYVMHVGESEYVSFNGNESALCAAGRNVLFGESRMREDVMSRAFAA